MVGRGQRQLEVALQAAIDVASHLIATSGWPTPESYGQAFATLGSRGVIAADLATALRRAAGLRNALAHDYLDIEPARLHADLPEDITELRSFCAAVLRFVRPRG